ncbi:MAG: GNAT family N-acetyltransferase [Ruminococcus sp.]
MNIIKRIFTKRYCQNCETIKSIRDDVQNTIKIAEKYEFSSIIFDEILKLNKFNEFIIRIYEQDNSCFFITVDYEYDYGNLLSGINIYGYLVERGSRKKIKIIQLFSKVVYDSLEYDVAKINHFYLIDIYCTNGRHGQGYGTKVMECFFEVIKPFNAKKIVGTLSPIDEFDENNKKRRNRFYEKFGFEINGRSICKYLH